MKASVLWGASLGGLVGYTAAVLAPSLPGLLFFPRLGTWGFGIVPGEPMIRWYGHLMWALVGAPVGMAGGHMLKRCPSWGLLCLISAAALLLLAWHDRSWFLS